MSHMSREQLPRILQNVKSYRTSRCERPGGKPRRRRRLRRRRRRGVCRESSNFSRVSVVVRRTTTLTREKSHVTNFIVTCLSLRDNLHDLIFWRIRTGYGHRQTANRSIIAVRCADVRQACSFPPLLEQEVVHVGGRCRRNQDFPTQLGGQGQCRGSIIGEKAG